MSLEGVIQTALLENGTLIITASFFFVCDGVGAFV